MSLDPIDPVRGVEPVTRPLHRGPAGESYARDGAEARWGAATLPHGPGHAPAEGVPVRLRGRVEPPTPFLPPHPERWGTYMWLVTAEARERVLLGPAPASSGPALRLASGDHVLVEGRRVHLHGEDVVVAEHIAHGGSHAVLRGPGHG